MRAAVYTRYGPPDVLEIRDVDKPIPGNDEVLVRVHATTVCAADWRMRKADPFLMRFMNGLSRPKKIPILGTEFAGRVESVGPAVTGFRAGDLVFGSTGLQFGAHAEYVCVPENGQLAIKPVNMTFDEAAAVLFGGVSALHFLRHAGIRAGQKVLIYGASGSVGVFAVQLAKHFGAHVTGVCSTANLDLVKSLGAHEVVDYTRDDFSRAGRVYDIVLDTVGKSGFSRSLRCLKRGGSYVLVGGSGELSSLLGLLLRGIWVSLTGAARVRGGMARAAPGDQAFLKELIEAGTLKTVIDKRYSLDEIAEAHRHAEGGHKKGHVVVVLDQTSGKVGSSASPARGGSSALPDLRTDLEMVEAIRKAQGALFDRLGGSIGRSSSHQSLTAAQLREVEEGLRQFPNSVPLWILRGDLIQLGGDDPACSLDDALNSYRKALELDPGSAHAHEEMGYFLDAVANEPAKAEPHFRRAIELGGGETARRGLARVLEQLESSK